MSNWDGSIISNNTTREPSEAGHTQNAHTEFSLFETNPKTANLDLILAYSLLKRMKEIYGKYCTVLSFLVRPKP